MEPKSANKTTKPNKFIKSRKPKKKKLRRIYSV
jgi:hypothetical protein